ncbi:MAG: sigma-70 family RNA polymerase sigma factor [Streptosporangiaceae bacterium]
MTGSPTGLLAAYDGYAAGLYGYCRSLLGDAADAADALQDTFVIAAARVGGLRSPVRLRSWLYAVARNECYGRLRAWARPTVPDVIGEVTDDAGSVIGFAQRDDLRHLLATAIAGLDPGDREVIGLSLWHGLGGLDLADVLGLPLRQAEALAGRARGQLERVAGAALVARTGRRDCVELDAILDAWDGKPRALWRKRVGWHIERCDICAAGKSEMLSPPVLLSLLPLMPLPAGLRRHVLALVTDDSLAVGYRSRVVRRAGRFDQAGFPLQAAPVAGPGSSGRVRGGPEPSRRVRGGGETGTDGAARAGGLGMAGSDGRPFAGERASLILFAAAAVVLIGGGGGVVASTLMDDTGHVNIGAHRPRVPGAVSATVPLSAPGSRPPGTPTSRPVAAPDPQPAGAPALPVPSALGFGRLPAPPRPAPSERARSTSATPSPTPSSSVAGPPLPSPSPSPSSSSSSPASSSPPASSPSPSPQPTVSALPPHISFSPVPRVKG